MSVPTIVQYGEQSSASLTMGATPTVGNLLVLLKTHDGTGGDGSTVQFGFTYQTGAHNGPDGISTRYGSLLTRVVQPGGAAPDNGFIQDILSGHADYYCWEFASPAALDVYAAVTNDPWTFNAPASAHHQTAGGAVTPTAGVDCTVFGFAGVRVGPGEDFVHTSTPDSGWTQDVFYADFNSNHPGPTILHKDITGPSGSYTPGANMTLTGAANGISYFGITWSIAGTSLLTFNRAVFIG